MLAVARILRTGAKLLLLDEISEGLAPVIVQGLARTIQELERRATRSSWRSRTSALPPRSPTASTSWSAAAWCRTSRQPSLQRMAMLHEYLGV